MTSKIREDSVAASVIGIDIGKEVFHLVGFSADGRLVLRQKVKRLALEATFKKLPPCIVGMEACLSAHFVSRTLRGMGFEPRIIPAIYVKPFNKGQKNDYNDAEAIAEAALRPNLRTVPEKGQDQLDLQAVCMGRHQLCVSVSGCWLKPILRKARTAGSSVKPIARSSACSAAPGLPAALSARAKVTQYGW